MDLAKKVLGEENNQEKLGRGTLLDVDGLEKSNSETTRELNIDLGLQRIIDYTIESFNILKWHRGEHSKPYG